MLRVFVVLFFLPFFLVLICLVLPYSVQLVNLIPSLAPSLLKIFLDRLVPLLTFSACPGSLSPTSSAFSPLSLGVCIPHYFLIWNVCLIPHYFPPLHLWGFLECPCTSNPVEVYSNLSFSSLCCLAPLCHKSPPPDVHAHQYTRHIQPQSQEIEVRPSSRKCQLLWDSPLQIQSSLDVE